MGGTVLANGRVHDGHVAVVEDAAAEVGTVLANGRVHDGHVAGVVVDPTPKAIGGTAACHGHVVECHRKAGTVGECSAGGVGRRVIAI